jgi:hypothetical protein
MPSELLLLSSATAPLACGGPSAAYAARLVFLFRGFRTHLVQVESLSNLLSVIESGFVYPPPGATPY